MREKWGYSNNLPKHKLSFKGDVLVEKEKDTSLKNNNKYFCLIVRKNGLIVLLVQSGIGDIALKRPLNRRALRENSLAALKVDSEYK